MPKTKDNKPNFLFRMFIRIASAVFVVFCAVTIINTQNAIAEKKHELAGIKEDIDALKLELKELQEIVDGENEEEIKRYMEKLAVEGNNYAYPDERRYYDTSRD